MSAIATETDFEVAYLGPEGSFSHLAAKLRYPGKSLIAFRTVPEIFAYVKNHPEGKGIVPIENSSGGLILHTVDGIIEHACSLFIEEELSLDVKLALLAAKPGPIHTIYSHFAPLYHCEPFLREKYPDARTVPCTSTTAAAEAAMKEEGAASIGPIGTAEIYSLQILEYPLRENVPNVTQFFVLSQQRQLPALGEKTSLVVALENRPGSLHEFLGPFARAAVNLTRIESRPIMGQPNTYRFLIEVIGTDDNPSIAAAFTEAQAVSTYFQNVGNYPVTPRFQS